MENLSRVENLLAMILLEQIKLQPQNMKIKMFHNAGFPNPEIATLLSTTPAAVSQTLYALKSAKSAKKAVTKKRVSSAKKAK